MSNRGLDLTSSVGRLECGQEHGSVFLLRDDLVATCRHCILPYLIEKHPLYVHFGNQRIDAEPLEPHIPEGHDTVFLHLSRSVSQDLLLPLVASHLPRGLAWETFGYPHVRGTVGMSLRGRVARTLYSEDLPRDLELACDGPGLPTDYRGLSGAPVVVDGAVRAMLQRQIDGGLGAITLARLHSFLDGANVVFRSAKDQVQLPPALAQEVESTIPNSRTLWQVEDAVEEQPDGYIVLTGPPGSGKTLIAASFRPSSVQTHVVGRYFAGGHAGTNLPPAHYQQLATFAQWLSYEAILRSGQAVAAPLESTTKQLSESVSDNLHAIADTPAGKTLNVLLIDGVDAATVVNSASFVDYLPQVPPKGLVVIFTTSDSAALAQRFSHLTIAKSLDITPLPLHACERLVTKRLPDRLLPSQVARVAELSQGHPLALAYYINEIRAAMERGELDPVSEVESSAGPLNDYYHKVWTRFANYGHIHYLLALLAVCRGAVSEQELIGIVPSDLKLTFTTAISHIRHLLSSNNGKLRFYHASFGEFVHSQASALQDQLHDTLATYCKSAPTSEYSIANLLYHSLRSSRHQQDVSLICTNELCDKAASHCVPPELVLSDLDNVLSNCLEAGDLKEVVRLLLLRSRIRYRYNQVFAKFATALAKATIALRSPEQSLRFIVREGHYICSLDDTVSLIRDLVLAGHFVDAENIFRDLRTRLWATYENGSAGYNVLQNHMVAACILATARTSRDRAPYLMELRRLNSLLEHNIEHADRMEDVDRNIVRSTIWGAIHGQFLWAYGFMPVLPSDSESLGTEAVELSLVLANADIISHEHGYLQPLPTRPHAPEWLKMLDRSEIAALLVGVAQQAEIPPNTESVVARALLRTSDKHAVVADLYAKSCPVVVEVSLREKNGVDSDLSSIERVRFDHEVQAFVGAEQSASRILYTTRHEWETPFFQAAAYVGRLSGHARRQKSLGHSLTNSSLFHQINTEFLPLVTFSLEERSQWECAYHIPEQVVPRLFAYAADIVAELEPESSAAMATMLIDTKERQLGLYTEGYQNLITGVADALATTSHGLQPAADLRRVLLRHISKQVFAREERVAGLLDCAHGLARLGAGEAAEEAFQLAIQSSLGPGWYKEDQFCLLLDAIEAVNTRDFSISQWKTTIETLAYASGDATFQRYVLHEKERLIEHLVQLGFLSQALATYLHYVLPSFQVQKARITRVDVDTTSTLSGNQFGLLEVYEQAGALTCFVALEVPHR